MVASNPLDLMRPFLWIAAFAFATGFSAYLLAGAGAGALSEARVQAQAQALPVTVA